MESIETPQKKLTPDVRVSVSLKLRECLQDWVGVDISRSQLAMPIWNDLLAADTTDEDDDADKALDSATRQMILDNIMTPEELKAVVAMSHAEHGL
ncbi:MAG: hypothetical protein G01um10148_901 [Parcubacteria group bacterium Gr01-1014_8]|nr:MAG: hypothetical protein G01um10148_901 [Parcubacteria group bacterium Gr01-1014_8]